MCTECECTSNVQQNRDHSMREAVFSNICFNVTDMQNLLPFYIIPDYQYCSGGDGKNEEREVSEKVRHQWAHVAEQAEVIDKVKAQSTASIVELKCNRASWIKVEIQRLLTYGLMSLNVIGKLSARKGKTCQCYSLIKLSITKYFAHL